MNNVNGRCECEVCATIRDERENGESTDMIAIFGADSPVYTQEDYEDSMDGDMESGLRDAGFGTDEDYGCAENYGGEDDSNDCCG